ncbi:hypothetical protein DL96DRAFT_1767300 [Flagelloscypha sp. PMI_526]|nr:hypothetical protein DL96DRAFT_1767300 [Flagelloscypha sp. PMI_526]
MSSSDLPLEIWDEVSSYLHTKDLLPLCQVSKAVLPYPRRHLYRFLRVDRVIVSRIMKHSSRHILHTTCLHFILTTGLDELDTKDTVAFIRCFERHDQLRSLSLVLKGSDSDFFVYSALQDLFSSLSKLRRLDIGVTPLGRSKEFSKYLRTTLAHPAIRGITFTVDPFVVKQLKRMKKKPIFREIDVVFQSQEHSNHEVLGQILHHIDVSQLSCLTLRPLNDDGLSSFLQTIHLPFLDQLTLHVYASCIWRLSSYVLPFANALVNLCIAINQDYVSLTRLEDIQDTLSKLPRDKLQLLILYLPTIRFSDELKWEQLGQQIKQFTRLHLVRICITQRALMTESELRQFTRSMVSESLKSANIEVLENTHPEDLWSWSSRSQERF